MKKLILLLTIVALFSCEKEQPTTPEIIKRSWILNEYGCIVFNDSMNVTIPYEYKDSLSIHKTDWSYTVSKNLITTWYFTWEIQEIELVNNIYYVTYKDLRDSTIKHLEEYKGLSRLKLINESENYYTFSFN